MTTNTNTTNNRHERLVVTIRDMLIGGPDNVGSEWDDEVTSPMLFWAKELGIDLSAPCNYLEDPSVPTGGPDDENWQQCRPLDFFTGPYFDYATERPRRIDVWTMLVLEESCVLLLNDAPKLGWWCSRGNFTKMNATEMSNATRGNRAALAAYISTPQPGDTLTKPIYENVWNA